MPPTLPRNSSSSASRPTTLLTALTRPRQHRIQGHHHQQRQTQNPAHARNPQQSRSIHATPALSARLIRRPHRPYTFTQLLTLSDGSTVAHRTTSPVSLYRSSKDVRNTPLWNPSNARISNIEEDEAGRLRAFRRRFGRGWDADSSGEGDKEGDVEGIVDVADGEVGEGEKVTVVDGVGARVDGVEEEGVQVGRSKSDDGKGKATTTQWSDEAEENLMDLIGSYGKGTEIKDNSAVARKGVPTAGGKGKKK